MTHTYPQPVARRRVWPWVLIGAVLLPTLLFVGCTALLGAAVSDTAARNKGGNVPFGQVFTYGDGWKIAAERPTPYKPKNIYELGRGEAAVQVKFTVTNGSDRAASMALTTTNATFNGAPAEQVFGVLDTWPTQQIAPGQSLTVTQAFKVPPKAKGPFQLAVQPGFAEPVFFTGNL